MLDRLVNLFNWRIASKQLLGLSDEWGKKFGKWRVTQEIADRAVDICQREWERVPVNVTREFEKNLNRAMTETHKTQNSEMQLTEQDLYFRHFDTIAGIIRKKNPQLRGKEGNWEIGSMIASMIRQVEADNPELITGIHSLPVIQKVLLFAEKLS